MSKGWHRQPKEHSLAAKRIRSRDEYLRRKRDFAVPEKKLFTVRLLEDGHFVAATTIAAECEEEAEDIAMGEWAEEIPRISEPDAVFDAVVEEVYK